LKPGLVPVLFGDCVFDSKLGGSVVSGDAILAHLAQKLKPKRILLGGNFEGVLDSAGKPIPLITARNFSSALRSVHAPQGADVTGGMKGKLRELRKIKGIPITLFDLRSASALKWALEGKKTGTALHF
ncbi:MAG: amino acid kinase, partial [Candidatus Diapherotrites archaeon]|nr:amino acid kinase [Candidatus Diapherotrites archaeon]